MEEKIKLLKEKASKKLNEILSTQELENIRVEFLGKKGEVVTLLKSLKDVEAEKRKELGMKANTLRDYIESQIQLKKDELTKNTTKI